jgi:protein phosphatase
MEISVGMHQHQGKREYQQDSMSIKQFGSIGVLAILADGMGGYEGGEIASKLVSENFREFIIESEDIAASLKKYLLKGNEAIKAYKKEHPEVKSMGTTAIAFFMSPKNCQWISVGDSPLYVIRNRKSISRINENHSVAGLLDLQVQKGEISQEEALSSGQRHMLTSAVSGDDIPQMDVSVPYSIKSNDIFILASDGIETISPDRIREIVLGHMPVITQQNAQNACEALINEVIAQDTPNQDNVTVIILAKIEDDEPETILYQPSIVKDKKKLTAIIGIVIFVVFLGVFGYFKFSDNAPSNTKDGNSTKTGEFPVQGDKQEDVASKQKNVTAITHVKEKVPKEINGSHMPDKVKKSVSGKAEKSEKKIDGSTMGEKASKSKSPDAKEKAKDEDKQKIKIEKKNVSEKELQEVQKKEAIEEAQKSGAV